MAAKNSSRLLTVVNSDWWY